MQEKYEITVRKATERDQETLRTIYNDEVLHGVATLDLHPKTAEEWSTWCSLHNHDNHPLLVAEMDGHVVGYASLSSYREKEAFASTVELSVYINEKFRKQGVATALLQQILEEAKRDSGTHMVVSVITAGNAASERLHERFGFVRCGLLHEAGYKMGAYRDVVFYELNV